LAFNLCMSDEEKSFITFQSDWNGFFPGFNLVFGQSEWRYPTDRKEQVLRLIWNQTLCPRRSA